MHLTRIRTQGLRSAEAVDLEQLDRLVELPAAPVGVAIADGLSMLAAALDPSRTARELVHLGLAATDDEAEVTVEGGLPVQVSLPQPADVLPLLPEDGSRQVTIGVDVSLDPPLFGRLRQDAMRDPRLVTALGAGGRITVKVGWLFTRDLSAASLSVLSLAVGEEVFALSGSERPPWLPELLCELGSRFGRVRWDEPVGDVAFRLLDAALSPEPARRDRYQRAAAALGAPPFELGALELVRVGERVEPTFGPSLRRARQFGPAAGEALRMVEGAYLEAPDVWVLESLGPWDREALKNWLMERVEGDGATLEQVLVAPGGPRE